MQTKTPASLIQSGGGESAAENGLQPHLFDVFLQTPAVLRDDGGGLLADIAEMPALGDKARQLLLFGGEADDEAVFRAVRVEPLLLLCAGEAHAGHGDVKGEAGLMFARSGGGDGVIGGGQAAVARPIRVILSIFGDGVVHQLLLLAVRAIGRGNLEIGNAVGDGGGEHLPQRFGGGSVGLCAGILDLHDVGGEYVFNRHQIGRRVVLAELVLTIDQNQEIGLRRLIGGKRAAAVEQLLRLCARQPVGAQAVDGLKPGDGLLRVCAEGAVGRIGEVAQINQRLLELFNVLAGGILFQRPGRNGGRRGGVGGRGGRHGRERIRGRGIGNQVRAAVAVLRAERGVNRRRGRDGRLGAGRGLDARHGGGVGQRVEVGRL